MATELGVDSSDYRTELLYPAIASENVSWRINMDEHRLPERLMESHFGIGFFLRTLRRQRKLVEYYKRQERLLKGYHEVDSYNDCGMLPENLSKDEMKQLKRGEKVAIYASNIGNMVLFAAKVCASHESRSLAVIASTMDSLLDLLSGFILWFTSHAMSKPNHYKYPIGKTRMQPVGIVVFASVMATLGLQILFESMREIITKAQPEIDPAKEKWMIGIMVTATLVKVVLMSYCRRFNNEIVRAYAQDHLFDVITNSIGLATAILAIKFYWWLDPLGAILIALYTISNWSKTVMENVASLIGKTAPPEYLAKLIYLCWNHDKEIKHIDTLRAYTLGSYYFVEVDIVVSQEMSLGQAHNIGDTLEDKLEKLPEIERAFVHLGLNTTHNFEHKQQKVT